MLHGDLSNDVPARVLVTYDAITREVTREKRFLGLFTTGLETHRVLDAVSLNRVWRYTGRAGGVRADLINFGVDQDEADARLDAIYQRYVNPFSASVAYDGPEDLIADLAYRPDVLGVVDIPSRQAMYGLRGMGESHLGRTI